MAKIEIDITEEMVGSMKVLAKAYLKKNISKESLSVFEEMDKNNYDQLSLSIGNSILNEIMIKAIEEKMKKEKT